jgi:hypothetical protein
MLVGTTTRNLGAYTDCRRFCGQHRASNIDASEIKLISGRL